jgi:hypothetical protein
VVESSLVLLGATAVVCILFWPLVVALGSMVVGEGSDTSGAMASFWWMQHEGGYHLFGTTHHTLTGAPFGWDEGSGNHIQSLLPYYPAWATKIIGPVAAYNFVLLAGYVLSGAAMYLLVRYLGCARLVAAWAGMVYIVFPWHLARTQAASLIHLEFLPLVLLALVAATRRPSWSRYSLVGLATLACWLTAGYLGAMAFVATAAYALTVPLAMGLRRGAGVFAGLLASALAATFAVAVLSVVSGFGRGAGLHRVAGDLRSTGSARSAHSGYRELPPGDRLDGFSLAFGLVPNPTKHVRWSADDALRYLIVAAWRALRFAREVSVLHAGLLAVPLQRS